MTRHGSFTIFLTLLMAFAPLHCLAHASQCGSATTEWNTEPVPVEQPSPCENESGCICRGAVLAEHVNPCVVAPHGFEFLVLEPALHFISPDEIASHAFRTLDHCPAPLSGRMLRARLASFLI